MQSASTNYAQEDKGEPLELACLSDPFNSFSRISGLLSFNLQDFGRDSSENFLLFNASTAASEQEGISAAGADAVSRRLTPALDAEVLLDGTTLSAASLPVSPKGIASPVVLTWACLNLLKMKAKVFDCGSFYSPKVEHQLISNLLAQCPSSGAALPAAHVDELFQVGKSIGADFAKNNPFIVMAECVPGGTTTAMAVLTAIGFDVSGLLSSSLPLSNHRQRYALVEKGLAQRSFSQKDCQENALLAIACVGDPMQAVLAGAALEAARHVPVILAGGSQMLAVWAVLKAIAEKCSDAKCLENIFVVTTKWVAFDGSANVRELAAMLQAPLAAACPDFKKSVHFGLRAYEEGNVKEGVGAGACLGLTRLASISESLVMSAIDEAYERLVQSNRS